MTVILFPEPSRATTAFATPLPAAPTPKRILALDGGGVRGMITICFLEEMEALLRRRHNRPDMVLANYFDLIGGTSVGSILATMLALGWNMARVRKEFDRMCPKVFSRRFGLGFILPKFSVGQLNHFLAKHIGDMPLDDTRLMTRLAIVTKRLDTGSAWVLTNNPASEWWDDKPETGHVGNRRYRVASLLRASTAAPTYFWPEKIRIAETIDGQIVDGLFVDGGLTPHNNPALLLFMTAAIKGYRADGNDAITAADGTLGNVGRTWELGEDKLLIISVGTGDFRFKIRTDSWGRYLAIMFGGRALMGMMADNQTFVLKTLQWLSRPRTHWPINGEVGNLADDELFTACGAPGPMFSFSRYDVKLEANWLKTELDRGYFGRARLERMQKLDNVTELFTYNQIGKQAAKMQVDDADFPACFDR